MNLYNKLMFAAVLLFLGGCSNVVFPEIVDTDEVVVSDEESGKKMMEEGMSLQNDEENASYADDVKPSPEKEEKIAEARTIPVIKNPPEGYREEKVVTNDENLNKLLEEGESSVEVPNPSFMQTVPSVNYQAETFYFDNGSAVLDSKYNSKIREIANIAKQNNATVNVYGYASSRTRNTDAISHKLANFEVSYNRAENVAKALRRAGVPKDKIVTEALSDSKPLYQEVMPEGERLNRRVEVYISY